LTPRLVRFTSTAQEHVRREKDWWLENRTHTDIFATELEQALKVLTVLPGAGTPYPYAEVAGLRRMYLRKTACHIYYTFDEHEVIVRALWGSKRGRGPAIEP
jgi:plasmid stabilization system protein ParE